MRLRSRKRERPLSVKRTTQQVTKLKTPLNKSLTKPPNAWKKILKRDSAKNGLQDSPLFCTTRSQIKLIARPVRTIVKSMEKPNEPLHKTKTKHKDDGRKKPIFQTVVRSTNKDPVTSTTSVKKPQNDKVSTTSKPKVKDVLTTKSVQLRHSSLNRELKKDTINTAMSSPRKTRRMDKGDKSASLNSSPIRKVRQLGIPSPKITKTAVSSTDESPKKKSKSKAPVVSEDSWNSDDNDVTMYEAHTTTLLDFPTPKSEESDSDAQVESSLCLPNDCLNDFIAIAECARLITEEISTEDADINFLADKAARVMTTDRDEQKRVSRTNSTEKRLIKRRKSSNDLEMYQPTSTTDDLDACTDFMTTEEKYVQVRLRI